MFGGGNRPKAQRGKPIKAAQINSGDRLLDQLAKLRGGRGVVWAPFGPQILQPGTQFRIGQTDSGGIPARNGNTLGYSDGVSEVYVTLNGPGNATIHTNDLAFEGFNLSSSAIAGNAYTIYALIWNIWICIWEDCSS